MYRQFELHADGGFQIVAWLENDPRLTRGRRLTLKGDEREWYVWTRYDKLLEHPPDKSWKVGGLA